MCTVLLPLGVNPIAINEYIISLRVSRIKTRGAIRPTPPLAVSRHGVVLN